MKGNITAWVWRREAREFRSPSRTGQGWDGWVRAGDDWQEFPSLPKSPQAQVKVRTSSSGSCRLAVAGPG